MFLFLNYFSKSFYVLKRHFLILSKYLKEMLFWPSKVNILTFQGQRLDLPRSKKWPFGMKNRHQKADLFEASFSKTSCRFFFVGVAHIALSLALDMTFSMLPSWVLNFVYYYWYIHILSISFISNEILFILFYII